jgi:hypothetical protein
LTSRLRTVETSDKVFFDTMADCASKVPIIVVGTQADEYKRVLKGRVLEDILRDHSGDHTAMLEHMDGMPQAVEQLFRERQTAIETDMRAIPRASFEGPVFVSKGMLVSARSE